MITILDYGVGNLASVEKAFQHLGCKTLVTQNKKDIEDAQFLVVPGQGAMKQAMAALKQLDVIVAIKAHIAKNKPFLGICLGFQILFDASDEHGGHDGLGVFPGKIIRFSDQSLKVPHMGWNPIHITDPENPLFQGIENETCMYFVHSYYLKTTNQEIVASTTQYGESFVSTVQKGNCIGTQYHPEKSGDVGIQLLKNFTTL